MILPAQNEDDLDELSSEARREMTFRPVSTFEEVVEVALGPLPVPSLPVPPAPAPLPPTEPAVAG